MIQVDSQSCIIIQVETVENHKLYSRSDIVTIHPQCAALLALGTVNQQFLFSVPSDDGKCALPTHMTTSKNVQCQSGGSDKIRVITRPEQGE